MNRLTIPLLFLAIISLLTDVSGQDTSIITLKEFDGGNKLASKNHKWGVVGPNNEVIYPFELYDSYKNYGNGLLRIGREWPDSLYYSEEKVFKPIQMMRYGLMDARTGRIILPPVYASISDFNNRRAIISTTMLSGIINDLGRILVPVTYKTLRALPNNNYAGRRGDTLFFLDPFLKPISRFTGLLRFEPSAGYCIFIYRMKEREGLANCDGKKIGDTNWVSVVDVKSGFAFVRTTRNHYAAYDIAKRKTIIDGDYQSYNFTEKSNVILMIKDDRYTVFDLTGKKTGGFNGEEVWFNDNMGFFVKQNKRWGYADRNGNLIIAPLWLHVERISGGNFKATIDDKEWKNYNGEGKIKQ